jgi:hypothetical protein
MWASRLFNHGFEELHQATSASGMKINCFSWTSCVVRNEKQKFLLGLHEFYEYVEYQEQVIGEFFKELLSPSPFLTTHQNAKFPFHNFW